MDACAVILTTVCEPCYPQGKPIDFVDVNEGNMRWIQDFRMKSYANPAKLESIDGKCVPTGHCQGNGLLRARILGKNDTEKAGKLCFKRKPWQMQLFYFLFKRKSWQLLCCFLIYLGMVILF